MPAPPSLTYLEYSSDRPVEGALTALLPKLQPVLTFDALRLCSRAWLADVYLTVFRRNAKRLFYLTLLRRGGKWVVRMGGGDPAQVLSAIRVCRDHFDQWFGVAALKQ